MSESADAFPNSDQLFQQAFADPDPVPALLKLLNEHPIYKSVRDLVFVYFDEIERNPSRGQALASSLVRLGKSPDAPTYNSSTLSEALWVELRDAHFKLPRDEEVTEYGPKNTYLLDSLLSGLSLQHNLASGGDQLASIDDGLDAPKNGSEESEVLVVGACIQLLMSGSTLLAEDVGTYRKTAEEVAKKLKDQKAGGVVKDPHAIKVLEVWF